MFYYRFYTIKSAEKFKKFQLLIEGGLTILNSILSMIQIFITLYYWTLRRLFDKLLIFLGIVD